MTFAEDWFRGSASALAAALLIDFAFGELPARIHPVVWMGRVVRLAEKVLPAQGRYRQLLGGALLALLLPLGSAGIGIAVLGLLRPWPWAAWASEVLLLTALFAVRALGAAARDVGRALGAADLEGARYALRSLCSRDASRLEPDELVAASIESLAENASDSWVAPLFYYMLFGLPGALAYRAVNTLDAMVGYHGHYEWSGKASARLDDVLNFIPARITAALLLLAGVVSGRDVRRGLSIWRRDSASTESPNAGHPMATMAGLLGVRLEKTGHYRLGDAVEALHPEQIDVAWRIVQLAGGVGSLLALSALAVTSSSG